MAFLIKNKKNWSAFLKWAAAILILGSILWMLNENNKLNDTLQTITNEKSILKEEKEQVETQLVQNSNIFEVLRSEQYQVYTLPGNQAVAPKAFAKVYINKKDGIVYVDAKALPAPPSGKVYQIWSLEMEPFASTSIGLMNDTNSAAEAIYKFMIFQDPETFGITLEPKGGSKTPTLSQLYVLGTIPL